MSCFYFNDLVIRLHCKNCKKGVIIIDEAPLPLLRSELEIMGINSLQCAKALKRYLRLVYLIPDGHNDYEIYSNINLFVINNIKDPAFNLNLISICYNTREELESNFESHSYLNYNFV